MDGYSTQRAPRRWLSRLFGVVGSLIALVSGFRVPVAAQQGKPPTQLSASELEALTAPPTRDSLGATPESRVFEPKAPISQILDSLFPVLPENNQPAVAMDAAPFEGQPETAIKPDNPLSPGGYEATIMEGDTLSQVLLTGFLEVGASPKSSDVYRIVTALSGMQDVQTIHPGQEVIINKTPRGYEVFFDGHPVFLTSDFQLMVNPAADGFVRTAQQGDTLIKLLKDSHRTVEARENWAPLTDEEALAVLAPLREVGADINLVFPRDRLAIVPFGEAGKARLFLVQEGGMVYSVLTQLPAKEVAPIVQNPTLLSIALTNYMRDALPVAETNEEAERRAAEKPYMLAELRQAVIDRLQNTTPLTYAERASMRAFLSNDIFGERAYGKLQYPEGLSEVEFLAHHIKLANERLG